MPGHREVLRDIMVLELLFSTGLRVSELCALNSGTFLLSKNELWLLVNGKGRKERILQVSTPELIWLVHTYCYEFAMEIHGQGTILFNRQGHPLTPQSVRRIIQKYLKQVGFVSNVTPHIFRQPNVKPKTKHYIDRCPLISQI